MSTFPSTLSALTDPLASERLNSPSHSAIERSQNDGIEKIEAFVGTLSSVQGTLMYDIRAAASNGGGHVQSANKGGTGQTSFTKGDLLVAQSSSVISKLAVGADGLALVADSTQNTGVKWTLSSPANFSTTSVFSGTSPSSFTDLNLSSIVGVTQRMVMLKAKTGAGSKLFVFRPNGDATEYYAAAATGANAIVTGGTDVAALAVVKTDTSGIVEWRTTSAEADCVISVESYW